MKVAASKNSGTAPWTVQFTNYSTGVIKGMLWEFGDGFSSTNCNPQHVFAASSNYTVVATAFPADPTQIPVQDKIGVKVARPWPNWAKAMALATALSSLIGTAIFLIRRRQRDKLRLTVFWWPEQATVCRRAELNTPDEVEDLKPDVPLRIRRVGKTQNILAEALDGACILASDGQETASQNIGQGARLVVKSPSTAEKVVAIAVNQKPRRPSSVASEITRTPIGVES